MIGGRWRLFWGILFCILRLIRRYYRMGLLSSIGRKHVQIARMWYVLSYFLVWAVPEYFRLPLSGGHEGLHLIGPYWYAALSLGQLTSHHWPSFGKEENKWNVLLWYSYFDRSVLFLLLYFFYDLIASSSSSSKVNNIVIFIRCKHAKVKSS